MASSTSDMGNETIKLTWEKITLGIEVGPKDNRSKKYILNNINGEALPGEMLAVMGPSGSGKTSLLNALARRNTSFEGSMKMNGIDMMGRGLLFNSRTAYMHQDEKFLPEVTCREHLLFQARLRTALPVAERVKKVNSLIQELGLEKIANSLIGDEHGEAGNRISRNERKRLSFATELLTNPTLLFVDEPTTGLDSFMAESVVKTLQSLAAGPRKCTIVATIHQPAADTYRLFDKVCFLVGGQVGYFGTLPGVVDFVTELNYPLPMHCCPADHILRLFVNPDDLEGSQRRRSEIVEAFAARKSANPAPTTVALSDTQIKEHVEMMQKADRDAATSRGLLTQICILTLREVLLRLRSQKVLRARLILCTVFGIWFGLTYLRVEVHQNSVFTVSSALFFCMMITVFTGPMTVAQVVPYQLKTFLRENRAGSYNILSMYASKILVDVPFEGFFAFIWGGITYWMVGFRGNRLDASFGDELEHFVYFWATLWLLSLLTFSLGYFAAFKAPLNTPEVGFILTLLLIIPQSIFGGLLVNFDVVPTWLHWLRDISILRHGYSMLNTIQWDNYGPVPCEAFYCPYGPEATGKDILKTWIGEANIGVDVAAMFGISAVVHVLAIINLLKKAKPSVFDSAAPDAGTASLAKGSTEEKGDTQILRPSSRMQISVHWTSVSFHPQGRAVLNKVTGAAKPGRLLVVMGPSGSGKTCLLNAITARNVNISGSVTFNGKPWEESLASMTAYMHQEDMFLPDLTVREHLSFTSLLKMSKSVTEGERQRRINDVITKLGLTNCQNTCIGRIGAGISGGERKRCSLAAEILSDPALLVTDEPTSGLDSAMAESVVRLLDDLAKGTDGSGPRTVVATIHQPSRDVFVNFADLLILADGRVAYYGEAAKAVDYFSELKYCCPADTNPPEHFMRLVSQHLGTSKAEKAEARKRIAEITDRAVQMEKDVDSFEMERICSIGKGGTASPFQQFLIIYRRETLLRRRSKIMFKAMLARTIFMSILVGLVWWQLEPTGSIPMVQSYMGALQFLVFNTIMTSGGGLCQTLPTLLPSVMRDNQNGLYSITSWYLGKILADFPFEIIFPAIFCTVSFWMVGVQHLVDGSGSQLQMWVIVTALTILAAQVSHAFGLLCASIAKSTQGSYGLFSAFVFPWTFYAGLMINFEEIPAYFEWLHWTSPLKYLYTSIVITAFEDADLDCPAGTVCPYPTGLNVLEQFAMKPSHRTRSIIAIVILIVAFRVLAWFFLVLASKRISLCKFCSLRPNSVAIAMEEEQDEPKDVAISL